MCFIYVGSLFAENFGIFIPDVGGRGLVIISSFIVGFVFFTGTEVDRSWEIVFVDEELILVDLTCRESTDDDEASFETANRSLLLLLLLFVDVCDWVVLGLNCNVDDDVLLTVGVVGLIGSFEDCFCCWFVLVIWGVFDDEIRGFLVIVDGIDFCSVFIEIDFVSGSFFFSSFVEDTRLVFLTDWIVFEFVDWVLDLVIGIVIVNFDCLLSLVDDEIGLVFVEIFLISVLVAAAAADDDEDDDDNWLTFFGIDDDGMVDFFGVVEERVLVLVFVLL